MPCHKILICLEVELHEYYYPTSIVQGIITNLGTITAGTSYPLQNPPLEDTVAAEESREALEDQDKE